MIEIETLFDPSVWCTDMASCNHNGINKVYGHEALTKMNGHEFHYHQSVQAIGRTTAKQLSQFWWPSSICSLVLWNECVHHVERFEGSNHVTELMGQKKIFHFQSFCFH